MPARSREPEVPFGQIVPAVTEILAHSKFADCNVNRMRQWGHMFLFYAFAALAVVTGWAIVYLYGHEIFHIEAFGRSISANSVSDERSGRDPGPPRFSCLCDRRDHSAESLAKAGKAGIGCAFRLDIPDDRHRRAPRACFPGPSAWPTSEVGYFRLRSSSHFHQVLVCL